VVDPERNTLLIDVIFESLRGQPYELYVVYDPSLANEGMDDSGSTEGDALLARDGTAASALISQPAFGRASSGYLGSSDGWTDLRPVSSRGGWSMTSRRWSSAPSSPRPACFAGERGEYALAAGQPADTWLAAMARSGNEGYMLPEQAWDGRPPSGQPGFGAGEGTFSATPLTWSHAQLVRLAGSIQVGYPIEQPSVVSCRYTPTCRR
jgi:GH15 family glucan-1,4-alpha-glucosidase